MRDAYLRTGLPLVLHVGIGVLLLVRWTRLQAEVRQRRLVLSHAEVVEDSWLLIPSGIRLYLMRMLLAIVA